MVFRQNTEKKKFASELKQIELKEQILVWIKTKWNEENNSFKTIDRQFVNCHNFQ